MTFMGNIRIENNKKLYPAIQINAIIVKPSMQFISQLIFAKEMCVILTDENTFFA